MKNYEKHIRFQDIELKVQKQHTKDISRVHFKIIQQNNEIHTTKKYGNVTPIDITWPCPIQFSYTAQRMFKFQTLCQHQYGYEIQQLKALYYGQIKIKPEDFFHVNRFVVFNKNGEKCGKVSFMIKVIDRQVGVKYDEDLQVQNRQRIRVDLVARLNFIQAKLQIHPLHFKDFQGKKHITRNSQVQIKFDDNYIIGKLKQNYLWTFKNNRKAELYQKSDDHIQVKVKQGQKIILEGKLPIPILLKNKRFTTQNVPMQNQKSLKIGIIKLEMRTIQKKQVLDLMYSPKKLQDVRMQSTNFDMQSSRLSQSIQKNSSFSQPVLQKLNKRMSLNTKNSRIQDLNLSNLQSPELSPNSKSKNKYEIYFRNQYQDYKFAKSKRFPDVRSNSPYISYVGQYQKSDFSPKRRNKGNDFSRTQRQDFTKPFKHNPGIGDYHLPSIWERS